MEGGVRGQIGWETSKRLSLFLNNFYLRLISASSLLFYFSVTLINLSSLLFIPISDLIFLVLFLLTSHALSHSPHLSSPIITLPTSLLLSSISQPLNPSPYLILLHSPLHSTLQGVKWTVEEEEASVLILPEDGSTGLDLSFSTNIFLLEKIKDPALV